MKILIVILIIVAIVQMGLYVYAHFFDINQNKATASYIGMLETATENFVTEKNNLQQFIHDRDETIKILQKRYDDVCRMHNLAVMYLPNIVQKEAMKHIINGETEIYPDSIQHLNEYLESLNKIKYNDEEKPKEYQV